MKTNETHSTNSKNGFDGITQSNAGYNSVPETSVAKISGTITAFSQAPSIQKAGIKTVSERIGIQNMLRILERKSEDNETVDNVFKSNLLDKGYMPAILNFAVNAGEDASIGYLTDSAYSDAAIFSSAGVENQINLPNATPNNISNILSAPIGGTEGYAHV